jgi:hypothetical protein
VRVSFDVGYKVPLTSTGRWSLVGLGRLLITEGLLRLRIQNRRRGRRMRIDLV